MLFLLSLTEHSGFSFYNRCQRAFADVLGTSWTIYIVIWVIVLGIGFLLSIHMMYVNVNRFSVNEKTFTTKWLNYWNNTSLDAKLPLFFAIFSLAFVGERLSSYRVTFFTKSDDQIPYMKLSYFCYGIMATVGGSFPILFSSRLAAVTILSPKEMSSLWLQTKLWIMIVAVVCITMQQLQLFDKNDAALKMVAYGSWILFFIALQFFGCAAISLFRLNGLKKMFVDNKKSDTLNIIKQMERQALTFIVVGAVSTLIVVFHMGLRAGVVTKSRPYCDFTRIVTTGVNQFVQLFFFFLFLYLNWPKRIGFNQNNKKVAPERKKHSVSNSVSSIGSEKPNNWN